MASIQDFILKQVTAQAGKVDIPSNLKDKVLGGLSDSIFGSLTQTAANRLPALLLHLQQTCLPKTF